MKKKISKKQSFPPKIFDTKSKELTDAFKKGGREGARKDFSRLLRKAAPKVKP
jgi:hypothetical protein